MPGRGEPLGDPHFWQILDEANRRGLYVVVYTNGFFLNEEKVKRLRDADISLYVKVDSFDRVFTKPSSAKRAYLIACGRI